MAGMGPPPKDADKRARQNATLALRKLPAAGRTGNSPGWPLIADVTLTTQRNRARRQAQEIREELEFLEGAQANKARRELTEAEEQAEVLDEMLKAQRKMERQLWNSLWHTPQAVAWEQLGWTRDVAAYVRHKVLAELGDLKHAQEARQWSDRLGLSPMAMLRLRWEIAPDEVGEQRQQHTAPTGARARRGTRTLRAVGE